MNLQRLLIVRDRLGQEFSVGDVVNIPDVRYPNDELYYRATIVSMCIPIVRRHHNDVVDVLLRCTYDEPDANGYISSAVVNSVNVIPEAEEDQYGERVEIVYFNTSSDDESESELETEDTLPYN
jgi:hypothetical protein